MPQQNYESDFTGDLRAHDINARECLHIYTYTEHWIKVLQKRMITNISCTMNNDVILYSQLEPFKLKIISDVSMMGLGVAVMFKSAMGVNILMSLQ